MTAYFSNISKNTIKLYLIAMFTLGFGLNLGCASGGFKLTRKYAQFVNSQNIIIRIVLYILTSVVFAATLLIDAVVFNTMDFWEGRVSAGEHTFEKDGKLYAVKHFYSGEKNLRNTQIQVFDKDTHGVGKAESVILLSETEDGQVNVFENGKLVRSEILVAAN